MAKLDGWKVAVMVAAVVVGATMAACKGKGDNKASSAVTGSGSGSGPGSGLSAAPSVAVAAMTPGTEAEAQFLVDGCIASGMSETQCNCAGAEARATLGGKLLVKMSTAPDDEDPKLETYYSAGEIQRIMTWVDGAAAKCGLEEVQ